MSPPGLGLVALLGWAVVAAAGPPPTLVALGEDGVLVVFRADRPETVRTLRLSGVSGRLIGLDQRPADGHLYGVSTANEVYRVDPSTGAAVRVSSMIVPFDGDVRSGVDFNPQADRLKLVSAEGQNLRVHVGLGAVAVDKPLAFADTDANRGRRPHVAASAYTNNVRDAATTKLFELDSELDALLLQDPPNDGIVTTIGPLGVDVDELAGFDIVSEREGVDEAWAASGTSLYTVDLATGHATPRGTIGAPGLRVVGLAASSEATPP